VPSLTEIAKWLVIIAAVVAVLAVFATFGTAASFAQGGMAGLVGWPKEVAVWALGQVGVLGYSSLAGFKAFGLVCVTSGTVVAFLRIAKLIAS
jgi:uncharacterized membrane protein